MLALVVYFEYCKYKVFNVIFDLAYYKELCYCEFTLLSTEEICHFSTKVDCIMFYYLQQHGKDHMEEITKLGTFII